MPVASFLLEQLQYVCIAGAAVPNFLLVECATRTQSFVHDSADCVVANLKGGRALRASQTSSPIQVTQMSACSS
eukprot:2413720-Amphidinium_carterae.1